MNYTLMHKNIPVADLILDEENGYIDKVVATHDAARLPIGTTWITGPEAGCANRGQLNDWWRGRTIPASREGFEPLLLGLGVRTAAALSQKAYGLSLSDQYWVRPENLSLQWKDVNFFDNAFSNDIGEILFRGGYIENDAVNLMSPDNTSDGWLRKKWVVSDGKRLLMKGGSGDYQQEPFNELVACAVMRRLDIPHVPYTLTVQDELPYSLCQTFITPETELVPAWRVLQTQKQDGKRSSFMHLLNCCDTLRIPDARAAIEKMLVVDYCIANTDRHYNNFGFVRNVDSLEWLGLAPVYDSGTSMWHHTQFVGREQESKPFKKTHAEQIQLVQNLDWFNAKQLHDLHEECDAIFAQSPFISKERRVALLDALTHNIELVRQLQLQRKPLSAQLKAGVEKSKAQFSDCAKNPQRSRNDMER